MRSAYAVVAVPVLGTRVLGPDLLGPGLLRLVTLGLVALGLVVPGIAVAETAPVAAMTQSPAPVMPVVTPQMQAIHRQMSQLQIDAIAEERAAVVALFEARGGASLFADSRGLTQRGSAVLDALKDADDYGLPAAELIPAKLPADGPLAQADIAETEIRLSLAALKYARYARGGRIPEPSKQLATYLDRQPQTQEPAAVLQALAEAVDAGAALRIRNPRHPAFEALRKAYIEARSTGTAKDAVSLNGGPSLKPGMRHPQIAVVRQLLKHAPPPAADGTAGDPALYDTDLVEPVEAFQKANGLEPADGIIGNRTRAAFESLKPPSAATLQANMEQWRWMPADLGTTHIVVNIPEFTIQMFANGSLVHTERVVTGLVTNQTPVFSDELKTVVLQPDWVLPESIKIREALPSLLGGGGMFWSNGLRIKRGERDVDPSEVRWSSANLKAYTFYQPPGEANVLGQVKFLFPNKHAVYMHDTPAKHLFDSQVRAFSHGCMRVRNPVKLAELVLEHDKGWTAEKVQSLIKDGPEDNKVALDHTIPVHVTYFTAVPDETGKIRTFRDIYGHEQRIKLALAGRWGEIDVPPDHLAPVEDREFEYSTAASDRRQAEAEERREYRSGGDEFGKALKSLFGGL